MNNNDLKEQRALWDLEQRVKQCQRQFPKVAKNKDYKWLFMQLINGFFNYEEARLNNYMELVRLYEDFQPELYDYFLGKARYSFSGLKIAALTETVCDPEQRYLPFNAKLRRFDASLRCTYRFKVIRDKNSKLLSVGKRESEENYELMEWLNKAVQEPSLAVEQPWQPYPLLS